MVEICKRFRAECDTFSAAHQAHIGFDAVRTENALECDAILAADLLERLVLGGVLKAGDHRCALQLLDRDTLSRCPVVVLGHEDALCLAHQIAGVECILMRGEIFTGQTVEREIDRAVLQTGHKISSRFCYEGDLQIGVIVEEAKDILEQTVGIDARAYADAKLALFDCAVGVNGLLKLFPMLNERLRLFAKLHTLGGDLQTVGGALKKLVSQLPFQFLELLERADCDTNNASAALEMFLRCAVSSA